jgi:hypothetical protein
LELNRVAFIEVFYLIARRHAAPVKENLFAAIIRSNEPKALWSDYFLDGAGHKISPRAESTQNCIFNAMY